MKKNYLSECYVRHTFVIKNRDTNRYDYVTKREVAGRTVATNLILILLNRSRQTPSIWPSSVHIKKPMTTLKMWAHSIHSALFRISGS